jgi:hypothetical protein
MCQAGYLYAYQILRGFFYGNVCLEVPTTDGVGSEILQTKDVLPIVFNKVVRLTNTIGGLLNFKEISSQRLTADALVSMLEKTKTPFRSFSNWATVVHQIRTGFFNLVSSWEQLRADKRCDHFFGTCQSEQHSSRSSRSLFLQCISIPLTWMQDSANGFDPLNTDHQALFWGMCMGPILRYLIGIIPVRIVFT